MIRGFGVENFKAFKEYNSIDFKKINILLGPNSSGKSSYLKALITIFNTIRSKEAEPAIQLDDQVGGFRSIVFGRSKDNIKFKLNISNNISFESLSSTLISESITDKGSIFLNAVVRIIDIDDSFNISKLTDFLRIQYELYKINPVKNIEFTIKETPKKPNTVHEFIVTLTNDETFTVFMKKNSYYIKFNNEEIDEPNIVEPFKFYFKFNTSKIHKISTDNLKKLLILEFSLREMEHCINYFMKNLIHMEPFRNEPTRSELVTNFKFNSVGSKGQNTLSTVIGLNDDKDKNKTNGILKKRVDYWLNEFDLAQAVDIEELKDNTYSLIIKNKFTGHPSNIVDVGVGTSQLLPIIIESIISPPGSVLLIEEPETHIHPNAQAKLGELFVECAENYEKHYFIETHSMYLVRQLQIMVAKKELNPDDLGVFYFEQDENGSHIKKMGMSINGQFSEEFPKGFFDVPFQLTKKFMEYL